MLVGWTAENIFCLGRLLAPQLRGKNAHVNLQNWQAMLVLVFGQTSTSLIATNCSYIFSHSQRSVNCRCFVQVDITLLFKTQFDISSVKWRVRAGQETSQDSVGVTRCKVSSAPPGRSAMAKGTTYIWPET